MDELAYDVERYLAEEAAREVDSTPDTAPYIQEGDVEDVIRAIGALGFQIVPKE